MRGWPSQRDSTGSRWRPSRTGTPPPEARRGRRGADLALGGPGRGSGQGGAGAAGRFAVLRAMPGDAYSGRRPRSAPLLSEDRAHRRRPDPDAPFRTFAIAPEPLAQPQFAIARKNTARASALIRTGAPASPLLSRGCERALMLRPQCERPSPIRRAPAWNNRRWSESSSSSALLRNGSRYASRPALPATSREVPFCSRVGGEAGRDS
jgi:hypothetical protein